MMSAAGATKPRFWMSLDAAQASSKYQRLQPPMAHRNSACGRSRRRFTGGKDTGRAASVSPPSRRIQHDASSQQIQQRASIIHAFQSFNQFKNPIRPFARNNPIGARKVFSQAGLAAERMPDETGQFL